MVCNYSKETDLDFDFESIHQRVSDLPLLIFNRQMVLVNGLAESKHSHSPNQEQSEAGELAVRIERKAEEHPEQRLA